MMVSYAAYSIIKAFHLVFVVTWFAGLFYLVRLFVYHQEAIEKNLHSDVVAQLKIMEARLWKVICVPSAALTFIFGVTLAWVLNIWHEPWFLGKVCLLVGLFVYHFQCGRFRRQLEKGESRCKKNSRFFRMFNEGATVFLVAIVLVAVTKKIEFGIAGFLLFFGLGILFFILAKIFKKNKAISIFILASFLSASAMAAKTEHTEVELVSENSQVSSGVNWIAIKFRPEKGWHIYWKNPGDSGMPPQFFWDLPWGVRVGEVAWPVPQKIEQAQLVTYGYGAEAFIMVPLEIGTFARLKSRLTISLKTKWLVCKELCLPEEARLSLELSLGNASKLDPKWAPEFKRARTEIPRPIRSKVEVNREGITLKTSGIQSHYVDFFPYKGSSLDPQTLELRKNDRGLELFWKHKVSVLDRKFTGGVLVIDKKESFAVAGEGASESSNENLGYFYKILLLAFFGGLLLNLMPCVFPIISIKALSLLQHGGRDIRGVRRSSFFYLAGILVSFWIFSVVLTILKEGGEKLGWGFQLQSPGFVVFLIGLFYLMALNLLGIFEWGSLFANWAGRILPKAKTREEGKSPSYLEDFFSGCLAVVVATPCTAPFMGTAMGYALSQPAGVMALIFTSLGLGFGAPYIVLGLWPSVARVFPRPGRWMERLKQILAFPLLATVIWLMTVVALQTDSQEVAKILVALLFFTGAVWIRQRHAHSKAIAFVVFLLFMVGVAIAIPRTSHAPKNISRDVSDGVWVFYRTSSVLAQLEAEERPYFVDFTAAWCLTCQVNKKLVLEKPEVLQAFQQAGVQLIRADWTDQNSDIAQEMQRHGRSGVPSYVLYRGKKQPAFVVLPEILTVGRLLKEIDLLRDRN